MRLEYLRKKIDGTDTDMVKLIAERVRIAQESGVIIETCLHTNPVTQRNAKD